MTTKQDETAQTVFEQVFDAPVAQRAGEIQRLCGGDDALRGAVVRLVELHDSAQAEGFLDEPLIRPITDRPTESVDERPPVPPALGRYRVIGYLGVGSSGVVYRAESPPPTERQVAIKLLRSGAPGSALQRFRVEQNALSALNHPGIAQIHDSGRSETGELFAVFELVEGPTITEFATNGKLDWRERLRMMVQVCDAVQHAHQHRVIHRDLKPSHLLVSTASDVPVVKVIDFGVSKMLSPRSVAAQTEHGRLVGTFAYMAPELLAGDRSIDTRVDVYALGIVLFEVLQGKHPHDEHLGSLADLVRVVGEGRIPALAGAHISCRRDLDAIIRKATHPDIERRYATPGHLADDLQRVLRGRPIEARAPSIRYTAVKFAARRPRLTAAGIAGIVVIIVLLFLTIAAGRRAGLQREALQDTVTYLSDDVLKELREMSGTSESRQRIASLLARRLDELRREGAASFEMRARHAIVLDALGDSLIEQGKYDEAAQVRRQTLAEYESLLAERPADRDLHRQYATAIVKMGDAIRGAGDLEAGSQWYNRAHTMIEQLSQDDPDNLRLQDDLCWSLERRADLLRHQGQVVEAAQMMEERLGLAKRLLAAQPDDAKAIHNVAAAHCQLFDVYRFALNRHDLALHHAEQAVPPAERLVAIEPSRFAYEVLAISAQRSLVRALLRAQQFERAEPLIEPLRKRADRLAQMNPQNPRVARMANAIHRETRIERD